MQKATAVQKNRAIQGATCSSQNSTHLSQNFSQRLIT